MAEGGYGLDQIIAREVKNQVEVILPAIEQQGIQFIQEVIRKGQQDGTIDLMEVLRNTAVVTPKGEEIKLASAKSRGLRTLLQGLAFDILLGLALVVLPIVKDLDLSTGAAWAILGGSIAKSILTSAFSYVMRLKVTPKYDQPGV